MTHPDSDRLRNALGRCASRAVRWSGVVYRSATPRYANKDDLLTGVGGRSAGARWNPPRSFPTVYASLDPHTALDEVLAHFRHYGIPIESAMPRVTVPVRVRLGRVLDLTDGPTRFALRVSARRMLHEPWARGAGGGPRGTHAGDRAPRPRARLGRAPRPFGGAAGRGEPHPLPRQPRPRQHARDRQRRRAAGPGMMCTQICRQIL
jgi:RES domain-containing protein